MHANPVSLCLASLATVALGGCMNIPQAKADLPRVELEVTVSLDNSFAAKLNGVDKAFHQQVTDHVMSKGDVGLRFYPVLSDEYARSQTRPPERPRRPGNRRRGASPFGTLASCRIPSKRSRAPRASRST